MAKITDKTAFAGETLTCAFAASDVDVAAKVMLSDGSTQTTADATRDGAKWTANVATDDFSGSVRWFAQATRADGSKAVVANGSIYVCPLVSKYRAVVTELETVLQNWGTNPNKQITVGEISISCKDREELVGLISYWRSRAEADERGTASASGPLKIQGGF